MTTSKELIKLEVEKLTLKTKERLQEVKRFAISEAWKILQLATAAVVQIIEAIGKDLAGPDKKAIALESISRFYDSIFLVIDIPVVPSILEPIIHKNVKAFLMILVGSSIDALVTTFRETGIFLQRNTLNS